MNSIIMNPILGYAVFVLCAGVLLLWMGRQARIVTDEVRKSNENAD